MPGRPKKKRKLESDELKNVGKLRRNGQKNCYSICNQSRHNKVTCPQKNGGAKGISKVRFDTNELIIMLNLLELY